MSDSQRVTWTAFAIIAIFCLFFFHGVFLSPLVIDLCKCWDVMSSFFKSLSPRQLFSFLRGEPHKEGSWISLSNFVTDFSLLSLSTLEEPFQQISLIDRWHPTLSLRASPASAVRSAAIRMTLMYFIYFYEWAVRFVMSWQYWVIRWWTECHQSVTC